jgi:hypothetical protein
MAVADQPDFQRGPARLDVLAGMTERVSRRGVAYLVGALPDGRVAYVLPRSRPARDGTTHHLCVTPAPAPTRAG